jgi:hypothetical protein
MRLRYYLILLVGVLLLNCRMFPLASANDHVLNLKETELLKGYTELNLSFEQYFKFNQDQYLKKLTDLSYSAWLRYQELAIKRQVLVYSLDNVFSEIDKIYSIDFKVAPDGFLKSKQMFQLLKKQVVKLDQQREEFLVLQEIQNKITPKEVMNVLPTPEINTPLPQTQWEYHYYVLLFLLILLIALSAFAVLSRNKLILAKVDFDRIKNELLAVCKFHLVYTKTGILVESLSSMKAFKINKTDYIDRAKALKKVESDSELFLISIASDKYFEYFVFPKAEAQEIIPEPPPLPFKAN